MALANVAVLLARRGKKVLVIDWDLEAPGLHEYFRVLQNSTATVDQKLGIVDILLAYLKGEPQVEWKEQLITFPLPTGGIDLLSAGKQDDEYTMRLQELNGFKLPQVEGIYDHLNRLRGEWKETYDFVLVDSRTGITDIGDVCTVLFPDVLVLPFVSNNQNIEGTKKIIARAGKAHGALPVDRSKLLFVPLLSRVELDKEYKRDLEWKDRIALEFSAQYEDWIPRSVKPRDVLDKVFIPYVAHWSFGESLPVVENERELSTPGTIGSAYARLANLIEHGLDWTKVDDSAHELFVREEQIKKAEREVLEVERKQVEELHRKTQEALARKERKSKWVSVVSTGITVAFTLAIALSQFFSVDRDRTDSVMVGPYDTLVITNALTRIQELTLSEGSVLELEDSIATATLNIGMLHLKGNITVSCIGTKGAAGANGTAGSPGSTCQDGLPGGDGQPGQNGGTGRSLDLLVDSMVVQGNPTITYDASGGDGGSGGNGGDGGAGGSARCEQKGANLTVLVCGPGAGGNGGNGGNGGLPGQSGREPMHKGLEKAWIEYRSDAGRGGSGGLAGREGAGGGGATCEGQAIVKGRNGTSGLAGREGISPLDGIVPVSNGGGLGSTQLDSLVADLFSENAGSRSRAYSELLNRYDRDPQLPGLLLSQAENQSRNKSGVYNVVALLGELDLLRLRADIPAIRRFAEAAKRQGPKTKEKAEVLLKKLPL